MMNKVVCPLCDLTMNKVVCPLCDLTKLQTLARDGLQKGAPLASSDKAVYDHWKNEFQEAIDFEEAK